MLNINERATSRVRKLLTLPVFPETHFSPPYFDSGDTPSNTVKLLTGGSQTLSEAKQFVRSRLGRFVQRKLDRSVPQNWNSFQHYKIVEEGVDPWDIDPDDHSTVVTDAVPPLCASVYDPTNLIRQGWTRCASSALHCTPHYGEFGNPISGLPDFKTVLSPHDIVAGPADLDELIAASMRKMVPFIRADVSLINFILELKDLASLKPYLKQVKAYAFRMGPVLWQLAKKFPQLLRDHKGTLKAWSYLTFSDVLRLVGEGHLEFNFNVAPFITDVIGIYTGLRKFLSSLSAKVNLASGVKTSHFVFFWNEYPDSFETSPSVSTKHALSSGGWLNTLVESRREVEYFPTVFRAQLQYNANYTKFQTEHARGLRLLDELGVNLNPQIVWNAIPWSFVIDWVVSVGDYLSQFRKGNLDPDINILQYSWSVFRERRIKVSVIDLTSFNDANSDVPAYYNLPVVRETAYRRVAGPPSDSLLRVSGLNLKEFTLALALAITRKHKHHKHG